MLEVFLGYLIWPERTHPSCRHLVLCTKKSPTITCILSYSHESLAVLHCRAYIWETKICVSERQSALNILGEVKKNKELCVQIYTYAFQNIVCNALWQISTKENNQKVNSSKKPNIKAKENKIRESWDRVFKKEKRNVQSKAQIGKQQILKRIKAIITVQ